MNKNIAIVLTAVILLGMALITYNEFATPVAPPFSAQKTEQNTAPTDTTNTNASAGSLTTPSPAAPAKQAPSTAQLAPSMAPSPVPSTPKASEPKASGNMQAAPAASQAPAPLAAPSVAPTPAPITPVAPSAQLAPSTQVAEAPKEVEDPVQKALEASRKESTLPLAATETAKPVEQAKKAEGPKVIKRITVMKVGDGTTVRLDSSQTPTYKTMRLNSPERLVIDLDGTWKLRAPGVPNNALVSNVRIGDHKDGSRIVIDLKKAPADIRYLKYGETGLDIRLR